MAYNFRLFHYSLCFYKINNDVPYFISDLSNFSLLCFFLGQYKFLVFFFFSAFHMFFTFFLHFSSFHFLAILFSVIGQSFWVPYHCKSIVKYIYLTFLKVVHLPTNWTVEDFSKDWEYSLMNWEYIKHLIHNMWSFPLE